MQENKTNPAFRFRSTLSEKFVVMQLDKIYCVSSHIQERLSEITGFPDLKALEAPIQEQFVLTRSKIEVLEKAYSLIGRQPQITACEDVVNLLESSFSSLQYATGDPEMRDSYLYDYLQIATCLTSAAFSGLIRICRRMSYLALIEILLPIGLELIIMEF